MSSFKTRKVANISMEDFGEILWPNISTNMGVEYFTYIELVSPFSRPWSVEHLLLWALSRAEALPLPPSHPAFGDLPSSEGTFLFQTIS